jgi:histidyl-tRNA synthetase
MSNKIQAIRGFKDLIGEEAACFTQIIEQVRSVAQSFGFADSYFPIMESTEIFKRSLGDSSDIVNKEMYSFLDRSNNSVTLRPEFTAGIVRSLISNSLYQSLPLKLFTWGPLFRYERPQKGRQRQFNQINFEYFGNESPRADAEMIALAYEILQKLEIADSTSLELNSLGCEVSRTNFKKALSEYLQKYKTDLSPESQIRLEKNPLRILDSKNHGDQEILKSAPKIDKFYTKEAASFFADLQESLCDLKIPYHINPQLVRGLDYYTHTVFEFTTDKLGSQNAILAGGRYDHLIEKLGGKPTSAVGFAGGMERIMALSKTTPQKLISIYVLPVDEAQEAHAFKLVNDFRKDGICAEFIPAKGNFGKRIQKADKAGATHVAIIGEDEIKTNKIKLKTLKTSKESTISPSFLFIELMKEE